MPITPTAVSHTASDAPVLRPRQGPASDAQQRRHAMSDDYLDEDASFLGSIDEEAEPSVRFTGLKGKPFLVNYSTA